MKHTLAALAGSAIFLVALPWWSGGELVASFEGVDAAIQDAAQGQVRAATTIERGVLRSFATTTLHRAGQGEEPPVVIEHTLFHGPLPIGELLHGRLPGGPAQALIETRVYLPEVDPEHVMGTITTRVDWSGLTHVELDAPAYERDIPQLRWSGATGSLVSADPSFERVGGTIEMPSFEVSLGDRVARIEDVFFDLESEPSSIEGLALGRGSVKIGLMQLEAPGDEFELAGLRWEQHADVDAETQTLASRFRADLDSLRLRDEDYGPGAFELVMRNLDLQAVGELQEFANAQTSRSLDEDAAAAQAMEQLQQILVRSPELEITELRFEGPDGVLQANGRTRIDGESPSLALGVLGAAGALSAEIDAEVPHRLLHKFLDQVLANQLATQPTSTQSIEAAALRSEWLEQLLEAGYVQRTPSGYQIRIEYSGGALRLNGLSVDPAAIAPGLRS